jgi:hypothetical protein
METLLEVNGNARPYRDGISDLEGLLLFVMENEKPDHEVITDVRVDGASFSEDYAHQARGVDLKEVVKVEVSTQGVDAFARSFLDQLPAYVEALESGFGNSVELLRVPGHEEEGHDMLARSLDTMKAIKFHLENVGNVLGQVDRVKESADLWAGFESLADRIMKAQEGTDPAAIADLLEHELLPLLKGWKTGVM